ncbi:MAG TPA: tetratricopeptide repeat protein, partial [Verrucomicrobiae bacterium]|nr:tetratricopeptide repeat protein [Verrucomicrobiae bacterium]
VARISNLFMDAQPPSTDTYLKVVQWMHDRRKPLLIGSIVVAVLALVCGFWAWNTAKHETDANSDFFAIPIEGGARTVALSQKPLLEVASTYSGTPAGEHAKALAAEQLFIEGKYPEAYQQFSEYIDTYPDSALIPQAKVGQAACLEAEGKTSEAISKYHDIVLMYPTELSIVSPAKLTLARLYEESSQLQQALTLYVELARMLTQSPNDPWAAEARERAQLLASKHPELMKAVTGGAPTENPNGAASGFTISQTPQNKPATAPATNTTNAPKTSAPSASPDNQSLNLLTIPGVSSNSTGKP